MMRSAGIAARSTISGSALGNARSICGHSGPSVSVVDSARTDTLGTAVPPTVQGGPPSGPAVGIEGSMGRSGRKSHQTARRRIELPDSGLPGVLSGVRSSGTVHRQSKHAIGSESSVYQAGAGKHRANWSDVGLAPPEADGERRSLRGNLERLHVIE